MFWAKHQQEPGLMLSRPPGQQTSRTDRSFVSQSATEVLLIKIQDSAIEPSKSSAGTGRFPVEEQKWLTVAMNL